MANKLSICLVIIHAIVEYCKLKKRIQVYLHHKCFELSVINYNNLQGIYIQTAAENDTFYKTSNEYNGNDTYYINDEMCDSLVCMYKYIYSVYTSYIYVTYI